jgi:HAD superfamily hydrolase (TIGR01509 family)
MDALLFDCDGVLAETERDGHRVAYNRAFAEFALQDSWSPDRYGELLRTTGGKERLRRHFYESGWDEAGWPGVAGDRERLIAELHARKTALFLEMVEQGEMPLRSGVARLVDAAIAEGVQLAVCSTSDPRAVQALVDARLGPARAPYMPVFAGDMAAAKKPDPSIYTLALERLGARPAWSLAVEDSRNGLLAAKAAGLRCLVTPSVYTREEDFAEADRVVAELGDDPATAITLADCRALCAGDGSGASKG